MQTADQCPLILPCHELYGFVLVLQGKLDEDKRQKLIQRGQELKDKLAALEENLTVVRHSGIPGG